MGFELQDGIFKAFVDRARKNFEDYQNIPNDTVFDELKEIARQQKLNDHDLSMSIAVYLLGFSSYYGFS